jgi:hypothetical protein
VKAKLADVTLLIKSNIVITTAEGPFENGSPLRMAAWSQNNESVKNVDKGDQISKRVKYLEVNFTDAGAVEGVFATKNNDVIAFSILGICKETKRVSGIMWSGSAPWPPPPPPSLSPSWTRHLAKTNRTHIWVRGRDIN